MRGEDSTAAACNLHVSSKEHRGRLSGEQPAERLAGTRDNDRSTGPPGLSRSGCYSHKSMSWRCKLKSADYRTSLPLTLFILLKMQNKGPCAVQLFCKFVII